MAYEAASAVARAEAQGAIPAMVTAPRQLLIAAFKSGDPESVELRQLLDACVLGAHRRRLREQMRAKGGCERR